MVDQTILVEVGLPCQSGEFYSAIFEDFISAIDITSRIGFWLWYAVPIGAFLIASPWAGAAIYGVYSTTRGMAVWAIILGLARKRENWDEWLLGQKETAHMVTATQLLLLGIAVVIAVGL